MTLKKYDEIMEKIKVTPEMRESVLKKIDAERKFKKSSLWEFA